MSTALKDWRESHNLTQAKAAKLVGVSRHNWHRWETGARKPDREFLTLIREKTDIPLRELRPDLVEMIEAAR